MIRWIASNDNLISIADLMLLIFLSKDISSVLVVYLLNWHDMCCSPTANRVVEVNEMWRAREKELELESKMKRSRGLGDARGEKRKSDLRNQSSSPRVEEEGIAYNSSYSDQEDGLGDDDIEKFLHSRSVFSIFWLFYYQHFTQVAICNVSDRDVTLVCYRVKRGRGAVGSRMDEPGPYLNVASRSQENEPNADTRVEEKWERRVQGPEKPLSLRSRSPDDYWRREALDGEPSSPELHKKKEKKKEKSSEKKDRKERRKKKDKKKSKHRHHHHHKSRQRE